MRRLLPCTALAVGLALGTTACAGGDGASTSATTVPVATTVDPAIAEFCAALADLGAGQVATLGEAEEVYQRLEATAPAELAPEVTAFVTTAREVSVAFAPLGDDATQAQTDAVFEALSPEAQAFVVAITEASVTGELPEGPVGDVFAFSALRCGTG